MQNKKGEVEEPSPVHIRETLQAANATGTTHSNTTKKHAGKELSAVSG
jgi:hypothetical protein